MRPALVFVPVLFAACAPDNSLAGKSWKPLLILDERQLDGMTFDAQDRLVVHGFFNSHTFRLDRTTDLWDDLGMFGDANTSQIRGAPDGEVYLTRAPVGALPTFYRLDDRTWTPLFQNDIENSSRTVFGSAGEIWRFNSDATATMTVIDKRGSDAWATTQTFDGVYSGFADNLGNILLTGERGTSKLSPTGDALLPFYTCGSVITPFCQSPPTAWHTDASGRGTFLQRNDITGSAVFRVSPGGTPTQLIGMPPIDVAAPSAFALDFDAAGNMYLQYGSNSGAAIHVYYLDADGGDWQDVITMPGPGYTFLVDRTGRAYAVPAQGVAYVLE